MFHVYKYFKLFGELIYIRVVIATVQITNHYHQWNYFANLTKILYCASKQEHFGGRHHTLQIDHFLMWLRHLFD